MTFMPWRLSTLVVFILALLGVGSLSWADVLKGKVVALADGDTVPSPWLPGVAGPGTADWAGLRLCVLGPRHC